MLCSKPSFGTGLVVSVGRNNITVWSLTWLAAAFITECLDGTNSSTDGHEVTPLCRCWQGGNMYRVGTHTHTYIHTITTHYYRTITKHKVLISEIFIFGNIINETVIGLPVLWCIFPLIFFLLSLSSCANQGLFCLISQGGYQQPACNIVFLMWLFGLIKFRLPFTLGLIDKKWVCVSKLLSLPYMYDTVFLCGWLSRLPLVLHYQTVCYMYLENTSQHLGNTSQHLTDFSTQRGGVVKRLI